MRVKQAILATLLFIATNIICGACDGLFSDDDNGNTTQEDKVVMIITADGESHTELDIDNECVQWQEGDKIVIIENSKNYETSSCTVVDDSGRAKFVVSFSRDASTDTFTYDAIYPAESVSPDDSVDSELVVVTLATEQHPTAASFDPAADILVAQRITAATQPTKLSMRFKRLVAIGAMTLENIPTQSTISRVSIAMDDNIALTGKNLIDCQKGNIHEYGYAHSSSMLHLVYDTPHKAAEPIYFMCNPITLSQGEEYTVTVTTTDNETFKRTVTIPQEHSLKLTAGKLTAFKVDMNPSNDNEDEFEDDKDEDDEEENEGGANDEDDQENESGDENEGNEDNEEGDESGDDNNDSEDIEDDNLGGDTDSKCVFRRVSYVTSGKAYLLAAEGYIATPITNKDYGYLQVEAGDTDNDGIIELDNCNNAFVIEATSGGYTLRQVADERYIYQYNNYNSFNMSAAPSEGYVWSITAYSGDTFTIKNNSKSKFIQYNGEYTSFGSYTNLQNEGVRPMLYELEGDIIIGDSELPGDNGSEDDNDEDLPIVTPDNKWMELPATPTESRYPNGVTVTVMDGNERNYTHFYDKSTYTTMWVAYPLESKHMGSYSRPSSWDWNPYIDTKYQVDLRSRSYTDSDVHVRGHLIPNASRNGIQNMQIQTFYVTNSVPQVHNNFNSGIWQSLESALQSIGERELIYIVTGVAFSKEGENKSISYTTAKDDTKQVPIPNYFYKVVLKVNTNSSGEVTGASTIGFWFENKAYSGSAYDNYTTTVDQIEAWTGFDFFVNLPDAIEASAETNSSWSTFKAW